MLTYKAMYKFLDEGVHGEVLDFPGTRSFASNLEQVKKEGRRRCATKACAGAHRQRSWRQPPGCAEVFLIGRGLYLSQSLFRP